MNLESEVARTQLPERIVAALLKHGLPVPTRDVVDRVGYSAVEVKAIMPTLSNPESS